MRNLDDLQRRLGYAFTDTTLLQRALSHRSAGPDHNERLEFLGDAVLASVISSMLYVRFADSDEGDLTRVRAHLVREETLHRLALAVGLPQLLRLSEGELRSGGAQRPSMLADALEAIVAAAYLDGGYEAARAVVAHVYGDLIDATEVGAWDKDPKTELQEWLQARKLPVPAYRIVATQGQAHAQTFEVECSVPSLQQSQRGTGRSRRAGEQDAARRLLAELGAAVLRTSPPDPTASTHEAQHGH